MPENNAYDQQPGESPRWYGRFYLFMLRGSSRSLLATYNAERALEGKSPAKSAPAAWDVAAATWHWLDRAARWDSEIRLKEHARWATRREEFRERQWDLADQLLKRAEDMLRSPLSNIDKEGNASEKWNFRDIANFIAEGSRLSRQSAEAWDGDLNAAIALVHKYYADLPAALAQWEKNKGSAISLSESPDQEPEEPDDDAFAKPP